MNSNGSFLHVMLNVTFNSSKVKNTGFASENVVKYTVAENLNTSVKYKEFASVLKY